MTGSPSAGISVIGPCSVASCQRPATTRLVLPVAGGTISGTVCERCERASLLAAFFLTLSAA